MKRVVFNHPWGGKKYLRIRDEWNKTTLTAKDASWTGIATVSELEITIDSFAEARRIIEWLWISQKSYQETYREIWKKEEIEFMIDEWPGLNPFVEIESIDEHMVRKWVSLLWRNWDEVIFGAVDEVYHRVYGVSHEVINNRASYRFDEPVIF
jgi:adenylate cyclase class 2